MYCDGAGNVSIGVVTTQSKLDVDGTIKRKGFTLATLPTVGIGAGSDAYASDEIGGPTIVFYDCTNWRRPSDNAIASS